jgi:hypothetical protein
VVGQVKRQFRLNVCLLWFENIVLVLVMLGHTLQGLLHGCIPTSFHFGCLFCGNSALQSTLFRLGGCLYVTMGGSGKILRNFFGSLVRVLQCF